MKNAFLSFIVFVGLCLCISCGQLLEERDSQRLDPALKASLIETEKRLCYLARVVQISTYGEGNVYPLPAWVWDASDEVKNQIGFQWVHGGPRFAACDGRLPGSDERKDFLFDVGHYAERYSEDVDTLGKDPSMDPFSPNGRPLRYVAWRGENGYLEEEEAMFILISCGPDGDEDINLYDCVKARVTEGNGAPTLSKYLAEHAWDAPGNDAGSGDIYLWSESVLAWRLLRSVQITLPLIPHEEWVLRDKRISEEMACRAEDRGWFEEAETPSDSNVQGG